MKRTEWTVAAAAILGAAYVAAAIFQPLVWSRVYWEDEAFGPPFADPPPTTFPIGRACSYMTFSGVRTRIVLERDGYAAVQEMLELGEHVDPSAQSVVLLDGWDYSSGCPHTLPSRSAA